MNLNNDVINLIPNIALFATLVVGILVYRSTRLKKGSKWIRQ